MLLWLWDTLLDMLIMNFACFLNYFLFTVSFSNPTESAAWCYPACHYCSVPLPQKKNPGRRIQLFTLTPSCVVSFDNTGNAEHAGSFQFVLYFLFYFVPLQNSRLGLRIKSSCSFALKLVKLFFSLTVLYTFTVSFLFSLSFLPHLFLVAVETVELFEKKDGIGLCALETILVVCF